MKIKGLHLFCLTIFITISISEASRLSQLNNILKSIKSEDGDVIDCVNMFHQPAFDHPLLKNHAIKMKPSYHPEGQFVQNKMSNFNSDVAKKAPTTQIWQLSGECPKGTIPVRKTRNNQDFLRASSMKKKHRNIPQASSSNAMNSVDLFRHEYAYSAAGQGKYYGTKVTVSVWQPHVEGRDEFSLSQIWVLGGPFSVVNTIEVGWIVFPELFGDNNTRLFVYWTSDGYHSTGCYNLLCSGFVQINHEMALGGSISNFSSDQYPHPEISILVWKDEKEHVWWLQYNGTLLGYWPATLFTYLNGSASLIEWGGEIINSDTYGIHTATQMGSGHFPQEGFGRASYFRNLEIMDESLSLRPPGDISGFASLPNCYNVTVGKNNDWGNFFFYGGPGRNPSCP